MAVKLTYEFSEAGDYEAINKLEERIKAMKLPKEIREASEKLGNRMEKNLKSMGLLDGLSIGLSDDLSKILTGKSFPICYGIVVEKFGIDIDNALKNYIYSQTSAMVTNCVKAIPLSQIEGQKILLDMYPVFSDLIAEVKKLDISMLGASTPGFDIRCMQHEELYSRLYMS